MNITVNGEETRLAEGTHIAGLLEILGLKPERLAIEVNRTLVRRSEWVSTGLVEGDKVEIVHFVGGGESEACFATEACCLTNRASWVTKDRDKRWQNHSS